MEVCFYEAFEEEASQLKRHLPTSIRAEFDWRAIQETGHEGPPARIVSIRTQSAIPVEWAGQIEAILTRSTGYDHVTGYRTRCGRTIPAGYLPLYCHRAVAEQAMLLWMSLLRQLPRQMEQFGSFLRDGLTGAECEGKTLLIVGVGHIGHEVARIGSGLGMSVLGVDIERKHQDVEYVSIEAGLARADVIVCAMSLNRDNHHYFDLARWEACRKGAVFVNVARGELAGLTDLLQALDTGQLGGVGLDVYEEEPALATALRAGRSDTDGIRLITELRRRPNVICTPHNAFNTLESVERKSRQSIEQIVHYLREGCFKWPVP